MSHLDVGRRSGRTKAMLEQALAAAREKKRVLVFVSHMRQHDYMRGLLAHLGATAEDQAWIRFQSAFEESGARLLRGTTKRTLIALWDHNCNEGGHTDLEWSRRFNAVEAALDRPEGDGPWIDDPATGRPWPQGQR